MVECGNCNGQRVVVNPQFEGWWATHEEHGINWGHSLAGHVKPAACMVDGATVPEEEMGCPECEGIGRTPTADGLAILELVRTFQ